MFGFLSANEQLLSEEELSRYKACYCGLCRTMQERHGLAARTALSFDMTFLILLLSSLYDSETEQGKNGCILHPFSEREWRKNRFTEYAADMNLVLAWYKSMDDWDDDRNLAAKTYAGLLKRGMEKVSASYGDKVARIGEKMSELRSLEVSGGDVRDPASACFGAVLEEVFAFREDRWTTDLRSLAFSLGRFIYVMDACVDLDADISRGRFNPFRYRAECADNRAYFESICKLFMGEVLLAMDRLPLIDDLGILKNILCHGVWAQFSQKYPSTDGE